MLGIIVFFLVIVSLTQAGEPMAAIAASCTKETSADPVKVRNLLLNGDFPSDPKLNKFALCVSNAAGFLNGRGDIQSSNIKSFLDTKVKDAKAVQEAMSKCLVKKTTPEDTAVTMWKCLIPYTNKG